MMGPDGAGGTAGAWLDVGCIESPSWGPADLAAALPPGPRAILAGLRQAGRRCTLVAWAPWAVSRTIAAALARAAAPLPAGAPTVLGAAVGRINFDGSACFWHPGAAALFDPEAGTVWYRGDLPAQVPAPATAGTGAPTPAGSCRRRALPVWKRAEYIAAVGTALRRIAAGDLHKVILSVPFKAAVPATPAAALAAFRHLSGAGTPREATPRAGTPGKGAPGAGAAGERPDGLAYLVAPVAGGTLVGISPEPLVLLAGRQAEMHVLAGTRAAAADPVAGAAAAIRTELLASAKDREEHRLAVAQARDDLQQVCVPGSVRLISDTVAESHPGLVHLATHVTGTVRPAAAAADLVRACFPAGTVSGVPRAPALALIGELEPQRRGWYAGAVGALLPDGDMQLWLTIRGALIAPGRSLVQTGAGIVATSDPVAEWRECLAKARPTLAALAAEVDAAWT